MTALATLLDSRNSNLPGQRPTNQTQAEFDRVLRIDVLRSTPGDGDRFLTFRQKTMTKIASYSTVYTYVIG
jgi:hypothetical protein